MDMTRRKLMNVLFHCTIRQRRTLINTEYLLNSCGLCEPHRNYL